MSEHRRTLNATVGPAILGSGVTGVVSLTAALLGLFAGEFPAASMSFTGAALSFGLPANALIRNQMTDHRPGRRSHLTVSCPYAGPEGADSACSTG